MSSLQARARTLAKHLPIIGRYERRLSEVHLQCKKLGWEVIELKRRLSMELAPTSRLMKWDVIDTLRTTTGATTYAQVMTPSTSADIHFRPEIRRFGASTSYFYATDLHRRDDDEARDIPLFDELVPLVAFAAKAGVVFVDAWHDYEVSVRTFELALRLVDEGGWLISHDCLPRNGDVIGPTPSKDYGLSWAGVTWRAFLDVTKRLPPGSRAFVIDSDMGLGLIQPSGPLDDAPRSTWQPTAEEARAAWREYVARPEALIPVVDPADWRRDPEAFIR
jgi:hypothetical protein